MLKFILISIIVIYVIAKVSKYLMRWAFILAGKKLQKEMEKQAAAQGAYAHTADTSYEEVNDMKIYVPRKERGKNMPRNFPGGDYVDFEEVK